VIIEDGILPRRESQLHGLFGPNDGTLCGDFVILIYKLSASRRLPLMNRMADILPMSGHKKINNLADMISAQYHLSLATFFSAPENMLPHHGMIDQPKDLVQPVALLDQCPGLHHRLAELCFGQPT